MGIHAAGRGGISCGVTGHMVMTNQGKVTFNWGDFMTRQTIGRQAVPVALAAVLALLLAGCGSGGDKTLPPVEDTASSSTASPSPDKSPSTAKPAEPSVSPAPEGTDLSRAQKSAYKKAIRDDAHTSKVIARLNRNPKPTKKTARKIKAITYMPLSNSYWESIQRYHKANVHIEGSGKTLWQVPVKVDLDAKRPTVVWKQCAGLGTTKVVKNNGETIPQDKTSEVVRVQSYVDSEGYWRPAKVKKVGSC